MSTTPDVTTALLTLAGALVGALPGIVSGFLTRRAEERKHLRDLVIKTAAENWRFTTANAKFAFPFEHHMIYTAMMSDLVFSDSEITEKTTLEHIKKVDAVMKTLAAHALQVSGMKTAA